MKIRRLIRILFTAIIIPAIYSTVGCSANMESYGQNENQNNPEQPAEKYRPLNILLDGKVSWKNAEGNVIPIPNLTVTMIDGEGTRTDSTKTNNNGRFLIEHSDVPVGYIGQKRHIYVEISDERTFEDPEGKTHFESRRIMKEIKNAPDNKAIITMDDIVVKKRG